MNLNRNAIIGILVVVVLVSGVYLYPAGQQADTDATATPPATTSP